MINQIIIFDYLQIVVKSMMIPILKSGNICKKKNCNCFGALVHRLTAYHPDTLSQYVSADIQNNQIITSYKLTKIKNFLCLECILYYHFRVICI